MQTLPDIVGASTACAWVWKDWELLGRFQKAKYEKPNAGNHTEYIHFERIEYLIWNGTMNTVEDSVELEQCKSMTSGPQKQPNWIQQILHRAKTLQFYMNLFILSDVIVRKLHIPLQYRSYRTNSKHKRDNKQNH